MALTRLIAANKTIEDARASAILLRTHTMIDSDLIKKREAQKKRIQDSNLPDADKQRLLMTSNNAKRLATQQYCQPRFEGSERLRMLRSRLLP